MHRIEIAVFAYNESAGIGLLLEDLARQTLTEHPDVGIRILCNGCTDDTAAVARSCLERLPSISAKTLIEDLSKGGKARTWNHFVSGLSETVEFALFVDADIRITDPCALEVLVTELGESGAAAVTSRPVKDLEALARRPLLAAIARRVGREHRDGPITGQLYAARTSVLRDIRLPVPCLVEDGFLSACLITGLFSHEAERGRVRASPRAAHTFAPPRTLGEFFTHDVRLALGTELNAALYTPLWGAPDRERRVELLREFAASRLVDRSIREHRQHPENSALRPGRALLRALRIDRARPGPDLLRLPLRVAHAVYLEAVHVRARGRFAQGVFQW